jgi:hypothetical protein
MITSMFLIAYTILLKDCISGPVGVRDDEATTGAKVVWSCGGNAVRHCMGWRKGRIVLQVFDGRVPA